MRTFCIMCLLAAGFAVLPACSEKSENGQQSTGGSTTTTTDGTGGQSSGNGGEAASGQTDNQQAAQSEEAPTPATPDGALFLFIEALSQGAYELALEYADPASAGYADLERAYETLQTAETNQNVPSNLRDRIRGWLMDPFKGATQEELAVEDDRARFQLTLATSDEPQVIELNRLDGRWYVLVPERFVTNNMPVDPTGGMGGGPGDN